MTNISKVLDIDLPGVDINSLHTTPLSTARTTGSDFHEIDTIPQIVNDAGESLL